MSAASATAMTSSTNFIIFCSLLVIFAGSCVSTASNSSEILKINNIKPEAESDTGDKTTSEESGKISQTIEDQSQVNIVNNTTEIKSTRKQNGGDSHRLKEQESSYHLIRLSSPSKSRVRPPIRRKTKQETFPKFIVTTKSPKNDRIIPSTSFTCQGRRVGSMYADVQTGCQVFHTCLQDGRKSSLFCPDGTMFDDESKVCEWNYEVSCRSNNHPHERRNTFLDLRKHVGERRGKDTKLHPETSKDGKSNDEEYSGYYEDEDVPYEDSSVDEDEASSVDGIDESTTEDGRSTTERRESTTEYESYKITTGSERDEGVTENYHTPSLKTFPKQSDTNGYDLITHSASNDNFNFFGGKMVTQASDVDYTADDVTEGNLHVTRGPGRYHVQITYPSPNGNVKISYGNDVYGNRYKHSTTVSGDGTRYETTTDEYAKPAKVAGNIFDSFRGGLPRRRKPIDGGPHKTGSGIDDYFRQPERTRIGNNRDDNRFDKFNKNILSDGWTGFDRRPYDPKSVRRPTIMKTSGRRLANRPPTINAFNSYRRPVSMDFPKQFRKQNGGNVRPFQRPFRNQGFGGGFESSRLTQHQFGRFYPPTLKRSPNRSKIRQGNLKNGPRIYREPGGTLYVPRFHSSSNLATTSTIGRSGKFASRFL